jgi:hypothetical protein
LCYNQREGMCHIYRFYFAELGDYEGTGVQFSTGPAGYSKSYQSYTYLESPCWLMVIDYKHKEGKMDEFYV